MNKKAVILTLILVLLCVIVPSFAQYGDKVGSAIDKLTDWLTKVIGGGLVVVGMIITGIRMSMHDEQALKKGALVIVGGLIIFLAKNILNLIKGFAG